MESLNSFLRPQAHLKKPMNGCCLTIMRVCLGGTFEFLHAGHQKLLDTALELAGPDGTVLIGVTTDEFAKHKGTHETYDQRVARLHRYLENHARGTSLCIVPLDDPYGPAVEGALDAIIISPETRPSAEHLNTEREKHGKPPLQIIEVPYVLAHDCKPISSTRIRQGELTPEGKPIRG
jgi:pantetheine-phosphate adenylyltransferase